MTAPTMHRPPRSGRTASRKASSRRSFVRRWSARRAVHHFVGDRRQLRRRVAIGVAVLGSALVAGGLAWLFWFSSVFAVTSVRVVGVDGAAGSAVLASANVPLGVPLARLDADAAASQVRSLLWVMSVEVRRGWPHEVVIAVEPKVALARLATGQSVAADGTSFTTPKGAMPVVTDSGAAVAGPVLPTVSAQGDALTQAMAALASLPVDLAARVKFVSASTRDDIDFTLRGGDLVHWGSAEKSVEKVQVLRALLVHSAAIYDVTSPELPTTWKRG